METMKLMSEVSTGEKLCGPLSHENGAQPYLLKLMVVKLITLPQMKRLELGNAFREIIND